MSALRKLLIVDDDPVVGASFKRVLSGKGYVVVSAENGQQALDRLQVEKFDAVFTDLRMPGMDGMQVAEKVRSEQPWTPVVIVTGYGSPSHEARARAAGVSAFLHKPLSPEMIESSAEMAVNTVFENVTAPAALAAAPAAPEAAAPGAEAEAEAAPRFSVLKTLKNMVLFLAAPFIGLVYAVLLPFVGLGMLLWVATEDLRKARTTAPETAQPAALRAVPEAPVAEAPAAVTPMAEAPATEPQAEAHGAWAAARFVLAVVAAPFIALAWIIVAPFAGLAGLAWMGLKAAFERTA